MPTNGMSPTQLTLRQLRREGYKPVEVVEHWNAFAHRREDLFGLFDILAVKGRETIAVQTTSYSHVSEHVDKMTEHENLGAIRDAGWTILVHGWKQKTKGGLWTARTVDLS